MNWRAFIATQLKYTTSTIKPEKTHSLSQHITCTPLSGKLSRRCLRSNGSTDLLITPPPYKPRSNKTATNFTVLVCIILSGDIQLNPSPSKCNSCKKSLKSNSPILTCNDCNKSVHIKCAGISRHEFNSTYRNLDTWHCSDCSAPCGICHRDVLNNHKAIHCDHCQKLIHTQCCAIDDNYYKQLIHSLCSWTCPDCNKFNFTNSFDSEIQTDNPFDPRNCNNHNSNETTTSSNNTTNDKKTYKHKKRSNCSYL